MKRVEWPWSRRTASALTLLGALPVFMAGCDRDAVSGVTLPEENPIYREVALASQSVARIFGELGSTADQIRFYGPLIAPYRDGEIMAFAPSPVVSESCLSDPGRVYHLTDDALGYAPSEETGAPANGVRFIVYALGIDDWTWDPTVAWPRQEVGSIDLTCAAGPSGATEISYELVVGDIVLLSVRSSDAVLQPTVQSGEFDIELRDSGRGFRASARSSLLRVPTRQTLGFTLVMNGNLQAEYSRSSNLDTGHGSLSLTISRAGSHPDPFTVRMSMVHDESGGLTGTIEHFDALSHSLIGCVTGTIDEPRAVPVAPASCSIPGTEVAELPPLETNRLWSTLLSFTTPREDLSLIVTEVVRAFVAHTGGVA